MNDKISGENTTVVYERVERKSSEIVINKAVSIQKEYSVVDIIFAYGMLVIGFLYWNLNHFDNLGLGVTAFAFILILAVNIYLHLGGIKHSKMSLAFMGILILSALNFALFDNTFINGWNFLFLSCLFVYWICICFGRRIENKLSLYIIGDMINQLMIVPFYNFTSCFTGIKRAFGKFKKGRGIINGVIGILCLLPILLIVINQLSIADAAFESIIDKIQFSLSENMYTHISQMFFGIPVAFYLFGLIYGNRYEINTKHITLESVNKNTQQLRFAPSVSVYSALTILNLIYLIFFLAQISYLFSAFRDSLPISMTYAEYARRGFFELCTVSGINLGVIAIAHLIGKRDKIKLLRLETSILCVFTIALITTAISKMALYINYYGLTRPRVYTCWFMSLLLLLFIIILIRQFKEFNGSRITIISFICLFMLLCYGNVDGAIAKYNIDRYQAGTLKNLDTVALARLSDAAVPELYQLYQETGDSELKARASQLITNKLYWRYHNPTEKVEASEYNYQSYKARQILELVLQDKKKQPQ